MILAKKWAKLQNYISPNIDSIEGDIVRFFYTIVILLTLADVLNGSTRGDVKIIEATENIQYLSQKIATDYFSLYSKPKDILLKRQLLKNIDNLQFFVEDIADTTKDTHTQNILNYFSYRIEQIKQLPNQEVTESSARLILKYSETLLEGAKSIAKEHKYQFSNEEKMLMTSKEIQYLIERVYKYYMAFQIGLDSGSNYEQIKNDIVTIDNNIEEIALYLYPAKFEEKLERIDRVWSINRVFLAKVDNSSIPTLLLGSTEYMKKLLKDIEQYHKKNL